MQFKNVLFFEISGSTVPETTAFSSALKKFAFTPCRATASLSSGWISPTEEKLGHGEVAPLLHAVNEYRMICLQSEEKILPPAVVCQELEEQVRKIERTQHRKVSTKEKYTMRQGIYGALLPKAFTKKNKLYAYFDIKNNWLILDTITVSKVELFLKILKKTFPNMRVVPPEIKNLSIVMTCWLLNENQPKSLEIEKSCVLQDPRDQKRMLRCQQQDLSAGTIKALLKDGYAVSQLELCWKNQIVFTLTDKFVLKSLKYQDTAFELAQGDISEEKQEKFNLEFLMMTDCLEKLLAHLIKALLKREA